MGKHTGSSLQPLNMLIFVRAILYGCPLWLPFFVFNPNEKRYTYFSSSKTILPSATIETMVEERLFKSNLTPASV
jgi:hypothetical protein